MLLLKGENYLPFFIFIFIVKNYETIYFNTLD